MQISGTSFSIRAALFLLSFIGLVIWLPVNKRFMFKKKLKTIRLGDFQAKGGEDIERG